MEMTCCSTPPMNRCVSCIGKRPLPCSAGEGRSPQVYDRQIHGISISIKLPSVMRLPTKLGR